VKKKLTPNKQEWIKNQKRAEKFIKKYEKIGFAFDFEMPKIPERVTKKALEDFKKQTTAIKLSTKAVHIADEVSGETETLYKYKQRRRKKEPPQEPPPEPPGDPTEGHPQIILEFFEKLLYLSTNPFNGYIPGNLLSYLKDLYAKNPLFMSNIAAEAEKKGLLDLPDKKYYYEEIINDIATFFSDLFFKRIREKEAKERGYYLGSESPVLQ
jgi:hypothetical protein